jgi:hypothetical protein
LQTAKKLHDKPLIIVSFSVKANDNQAMTILSQFNEIAHREAGPRGRSAVLVKAMAEYNQRHEEGNPQLKIASYLPTVSQSPMRVICWRFLKGATKDGQVLCSLSGEGRWINGISCFSCRNNQLRKKVTTNMQRSVS